MTTKHEFAERLARELNSNPGYYMGHWAAIVEPVDIEIAITAADLDQTFYPDDET